MTTVAKVRKRDLKSKPVQGKCWKTFTWIPAKRGSISGRQHPDIAEVQIRFSTGNSIHIIREWNFEVECNEDYLKAKAHYDYINLD